MKKQIADNVDDDILQLLSRAAEGLSFSEIMAQLTTPPTSRTLHRHLAALLEKGKLRRVGEGRATRYYTVATTDTISKTSGAKQGLIQISEEGEEVKNYVTQAIQFRRPVSYHREFLESYIPNETYYLPTALRDHLKQIGSQFNGEEPAGTFARKILERLLIDLSWNSSRLEGNTYSLIETQQLIQFGEVAVGKSAIEAQMILNHKAAIEFLVESIDSINFNFYTICNIHALLSDGLLGNPAACGRVRSIAVGIGRTVYHPLEIPQLIEESLKIILEKAALILDPFEKAFFVTVHIPYLQAFEDVNKRVSRLSANIPFIKNNLCPLSFIDVPKKEYVDGLLGVYELNRIELLRDIFVWAYERSSLRYSAIQGSLGEPDPMRVQYRSSIIRVIHDVITKKLIPSAASTFIQNWATENIGKEDQRRFVELVEIELLGLHRGNFARFRVTPNEFDTWQKTWKQKKN